MGIVDSFKARGLRCFGPGRKGAQLEGSKAFTKEFLKRHGIPTAASDDVHERDVRSRVRAEAAHADRGEGQRPRGRQGRDHLRDRTRKRSPTARAMFDGQFGDAGTEVVIEEFLEGEEASFIVMADGKNILPFASSQDHKRRDDGDHGPNTGGMGAYSPAPVVTPAMHARIMKQVIEPTIRGLEKDGMPYTGFLYAGIMVAPDGTPNVLEFNCRFGDPETQPIMMRLQSDLTELCEAALDGRLDKVKAKWDEQAALGMVLAAGGYPDTVRRDDVIQGLDVAAKLPGKVFHAGTKLDESGNVVTNGGRVLCAVGLGANVREAQRAAYALADEIHWNGLQFRRDIGYRAVERERASTRGGK